MVDEIVFVEETYSVSSVIGIHAFQNDYHQALGEL